MAIQSKEVLTDDGRQYHIHCKKGEIGKYVLLPGDPFRTDIIAKHLADPHLVAHNREHKTWSGYLCGELVSVTSTGMGGPSTAIAVEELIHCGAEVFIRVGTCGRICPESFNEELEGVVITGAIRDEGTTIHYMPIEYPAIADREITNALVESASEMGYPFAEGIAQSKDESEFSKASTLVMSMWFVGSSKIKRERGFCTASAIISLRNSPGLNPAFKECATFEKSFSLN